MAADRATEARQRAEWVMTVQWFEPISVTDRDRLARDVLWLLDDRERLTKAVGSVELCVENIGLIVATFAPHGYDSSRPAAYDLANKLKVEIEAIRAALSAVSERKPA